MKTSYRGLDWRVVTTSKWSRIVDQSDWTIRDQARQAQVTQRVHTAVRGREKFRILYFNLAIGRLGRPTPIEHGQSPVWPGPF